MCLSMSTGLLFLGCCWGVLSASSNLAERFRALFTLRNINGPAAIDQIARGWLEHRSCTFISNIRPRLTIIIHSVV